MFRCFNIHVQYFPKENKHASYFESFYNLDKKEAKERINKILDKDNFILLNVEEVKQIRPKNNA